MLDKIWKNKMEGTQDLVGIFSFFVLYTVCSLFETEEIILFLNMSTCNLNEL